MLQVYRLGYYPIQRKSGRNRICRAPVAFIQRTAVDGEGYIVLIADGIYRGDLVRVDIKLR